VERGWSGANEHYTQQNSIIDDSIENLVKAENLKYIVCLLQTNSLFICLEDSLPSACIMYPKQRATVSVGSVFK
jgi:hypothetical protein